MVTCGFVFCLDDESGMKQANVGKCPKISYTKVSDEMTYANNADIDQTVSEGAFCLG